MSTRPQLCAQLGMDSQPCSYSAALLVTSASPVVNPQVTSSLSNTRSPHAVDNPGGSALCRPVDSGGRLCTAPRVDNTVRIRLVTGERPPSRGGRGPLGGGGRPSCRQKDLAPLNPRKLGLSLRARPACEWRGAGGSSFSASAST